MQLGKFEKLMFCNCEFAREIWTDVKLDVERCGYEERWFLLSAPGHRLELGVQRILWDTLWHWGLQVDQWPCWQDGELIVYIWWFSTYEQLPQFRRTRRQKQNGFHLSMKRSPKLNVSRFQIVALSWTTSWPGYLSGWCHTRPPGEGRWLLLWPIINCSLFTFLTKSIFLTTVKPTPFFTTYNKNLM